MTSAEISLSVATSQDKQDWNSYVHTHHKASAYHQFAWLEAVQNAYGHRALGVIARNKKNAQVIGVLPAVLMKTPLLGRKICALPFCDVGYAVSNDPTITESMQTFLIQRMALTGSKKLEIRNTNAISSDNESLAHKKVRMLLPLPESSEALMDSFKSKLRSQIRKAEKNGLTFTLNTTSQALTHFYEVYAQNMRDLGSPVHAKKWFEQVVNTYKDDCIISVVYNGKFPVGAGLVIKNGSNASIPWASTLREYNKLAPNMLLYWSLLAHCANNGIEIFDFGRSTFEEGTYKFKKQWGAKPQLLNWEQYSASGAVQNAISAAQSSGKLRVTVENIWRKLPLKVTTMIGAAIRPYLSL